MGACGVRSVVKSAEMLSEPRSFQSVRPGSAAKLMGSTSALSLVEVTLTKEASGVLGMTIAEWSPLVLKTRFHLLPLTWKESAPTI